MRVPAWALCAGQLLLHLGGRLASLPRLPGQIALALREPAQPFRGNSEVEADGRKLVYLSSPAAFSLGSYGFRERALAHRPLPSAVRILLAPAFGALSVRRTGERSLSLRSLCGSFFALELDGGEPGRSPLHLEKRHSDAFRRNTFPALGEPIPLGEDVVSITQLGGDGLPGEITFESPVALDDPSLVWLVWSWRSQSYEPFRLPQIGSAVEVPGPS